MPTALARVMPILAFSLLLTASNHAAAQGVTVDDIINDFGMLLDPGASQPGRVPATPIPSNGSSSGTSGPAAGLSGTSNGSSGASASYAGDMQVESKLNFEAFWEGFLGELLKLQGLGFADVRNRRVDLDMVAGKLHMIIDGEKVSIRPVNVTFKTKWGSTVDGRAEAGGASYSWTFQFEDAKFAPGQIAGNLTLVAKANVDPKLEHIAGRWTATPRRTGGYDVEVVLAPKKRPGSISDGIYHAFTDDPSMWERLRLETHRESDGFFSFPRFSAGAKPMWRVMPVASSGDPSPQTPPGTGSHSSDAASTGQVPPGNGPPADPSGGQNGFVPGRPDADILDQLLPGTSADHTPGSVGPYQSPAAWALPNSGGQGDNRSTLSTHVKLDPKKRPYAESLWDDIARGNYSRRRRDQYSGVETPGAAPQDGRLDIRFGEGGGERHQGEGESGQIKLPEEGKVDQDLEMLGIQTDQ